MRKLDFCQFENKDADQLCSNCTADQRLFFRYTDSMITTLVKSKISSFKPFPVTAQAGLCQTWSETPNTGFLAWRLSHLLACKNEDSVSESRRTDVGIIQILDALKSYM